MRDDFRGSSSSTRRLPARTFPQSLKWGLLVAAAAAPIAVLALYSYNVSAYSVRRLVSERNKSSASITALLLERELGRSISFARTLAALPGTIEMVESRDVDTMRLRLKAVVESNAGLDRATASDIGGTLWSDYKPAPETLGKNISDREWFRGVSKDWEPYVSGVYKRLSDVKPLVVVVAVPVKKNGQPIGVLAFHYRLEGLAGWLKEIEEKSAGSAIVIDPAGLVAVHSRLDLQAREYAEYAALEPVQRALAGENVHTHYDDPFSGETMTASMVPVVVAGRRWVVISQQPIEAAYAPLATLRLQIAAAAVILAVLLVVLAIVLGRVTDRISRLNAILKEHNHKLTQLAHVVNSSNDAILSTTLQGCITSWNPGAERIYGYSAAEALGASVSMLCPPQMLERQDEFLARVANGERIEALEVQRIAKGGRPLSVSISIAPLLSEHGVIEGATAITRDVTAQRKAESALRENIERFELIARGTRDGLWDWNIETNEVYFSPRWKEMLGYAGDEIANRFSEWEKLVHPEDIEGAKALITRYLSQEIPAYELEHRLLHKDGTYRWILARGFALRHPDGRPYRMAGSHFDLTDHKRAAGELAQKAKELARSNAELEQFAYVASHDLREPLRMINSYSQLLVKHAGQKLDDSEKTYLAQIHDGAERMKSLITDLLDYSRVNTRGKPFAPVDCNGVLDIARQNLKVALEESGGTLSAEPLPVIPGDFMQLTRLFQNLLDNALKFKGPRAPVIRIAALQEKQGWHFIFQDNGIGIDPQHFKRIFAIFQRLHTREEYPGTGIGLSVCRRIVERHGGNIWVESTPGEGSAFHFILDTKAQADGAT